MLKSFKKITVKDIVYWTVRVLEEAEQETLRQSQRQLFGEEEKQPADILTEEAVEENVKNHVPILNLVSSCQQMINDNKQEWMNEDKEQQLNDNTADLKMTIQLMITEYRNLAK